MIFHPTWTPSQIEDALVYIWKNDEIMLCADIMIHVDL